MTKEDMTVDQIRRALVAKLGLQRDPENATIAELIDEVYRKGRNDGIQAGKHASEDAAVSFD